LHETKFMSAASIYLESIRKRFAQYKQLCDDAFLQLEEKDFHFCPAEDSNSISMLVRHMSGNMRSRFTAFLTSDGEKVWRNRDAEFEATDITSDQLIQEWNESWQCVFDALDALNEENLSSTITIRNQPHSVVDALHRQLGHYAYHAGQIVLLAKMIKGKAWKSLSIPKGGSLAFNEQMRKQQTT